jgi:hypothetical protein
MELPTQLQEAIDRPKSFPLLQFVPKAFEVTNRRVWQFVLASFVYFVLFIAVYIVLILFAGIFAFAGFSGFAIESNNAPTATMLMSIFGLIFFILIVIWALAVPIPAGYAHAAQLSDRGDEVTLGDFFAGYQARWKGLLFTSILVSLCSIICLLPSIALMGGVYAEMMAQQMMGEIADPTQLLASMGAANFLYFILYSALRSLYMWSYLVTWFYGISGWSAMEASRKLMGWNFLWVLLFDILLGITIFVSMAVLTIVFGLLGNLITVLFVFFLLFFIPFYLVPCYLNFIYASFAHTVRLNEKTETAQEDKIIDHFMPDNE